MLLTNKDGGRYIELEVDFDDGGFSRIGDAHRLLNTFPAAEYVTFTFKGETIGRLQRGGPKGDMGEGRSKH